MKTFKQFIAEGDLSPYDLSLTKQEQIALRDRIAKLLKIDQKRVAYQQILAPHRHYLTVYFVAEVPHLDPDDAAFQARMVAKDAKVQAEKVFRGATIDTTFKVIHPRQGQSIKIKHKVTPA